MHPVNRESSFSEATRYGLDDPAIESRWGARFSTPVQTGPRFHPASHTMGTDSFPGVKRPGRGVNHPPHLVPRLKKGKAIPVLPLCAFVACSRVNFTCLHPSATLTITYRTKLVAQQIQQYSYQHREDLQRKYCHVLKFAVNYACIAV